jgi:ketosteroid isomerase-like protein
MKAFIILVFILLKFVGCTSQQGDQLTQQQRDQIKMEIKAVNDSMTARMQRLDERSLLQYYWDSPQFLMCTMGGSTMDIQGLKKAMEWCDDSISVHQFTALREEFPVVTKDQVVYVCIGSDHTALKSGEKMTIEKDAITEVFRKIDGNWKIVYTHESGAFKTEKAGKK